MSKLNDVDKKRALVLRLKRVEGQLRGIQNLIETEADCLSRKTLVNSKHPPNVANILRRCLPDLHKDDHEKIRSSHSAF
jgi:hypothetical protein